MPPFDKYQALKVRTLANGCTPGEVEAAQRLMARIAEQHPEVLQPQPKVHVFKTFQWNPFSAEEAIREGMRRAARQGRGSTTPHAKQEVFAAAERGAKNKTAALRAAARGWRAEGWLRAAFVNEAVARGYASATASTQWQRSYSQD